MHIRDMTLKEYLSSTEQTDEQFAAVVGVSRPTITRIRNGSHLPSIKNALKIVDKTGGKVTLPELLGQPA